jgi:hypothetical protein
VDRRCLDPWRTILNLIDSEGAAERDQSINLWAIRNTLQAVIGDHRPHTVADHNVRRPIFRAGLQLSQEAAADLLLDVVGLSRARGPGDIKKVMMHIA